MMFNLLSFFLLFSKLNAYECGIDSPINTFKPRYSSNFKINYFKDYKIVESGNFKYLLSEQVINCQFDGIKIKNPVKKIAATSTTHLAALSMLKKENSLRGFQGVRYIYSTEFNKKIFNLDYKLNVEELYKNQFDLVVAYDDNLVSLNQIENFKRLNVPVVFDYDFLETSSLARAEWIIFLASFFNEEKLAQSKFKEIEENYLKNKTVGKTKVLVGEIQRGKWVTCGGTSDLAQLIKDAGGELVLKSNSSKTIEIPLEKIIALKLNVDIWLPQNNFKSKREIDQKYSYIKYRRIFNNNKRLNNFGANDYWEEGMQRPDLLLIDLKNIFDNKKLTQLKWYKEL